MTHLGELAALASALIWAGSLCTFRAFGTGISASTLNCFKTIVALVALTVALGVVWPQWPTEPKLWLLLGASGVLGLALGDTFFFAALKRLGAQRTSSLQCLATPLSVLIAFGFLEERLTPWQLGGMTLTIAAVLGVIWSGRRPGETTRADGFAAGVTFAVLAALCQAIGVCLSRPALQGTHVLVGTTLRVVPTCLVLLAVERLRAPGGVSLRALHRDRRRFAALSAAALAGTFIGVFLLAVATKYAEAGVVTALSGTFPVWVVPIAVFALKEKAAPSTVLWTLVAVLGVCLTLR